MLAQRSYRPYRRCRADRLIWRFWLRMRLVGPGAGVSLEVRAAETPGIESIALLPPPARTPPTLFTTVPSTKSGIHAPNPYDDPSMWTTHFERFAYGSVGTGVAIGDYDGDGRPDLFLVSKTGRNFLFRNLGDFRFEDVTEAAGVGGANGCLENGRDVCRREQRWTPRSLRLPRGGGQSALSQPR